MVEQNPKVWSKAFQVKLRGDLFVVDATAHTCRCRTWDLTVIPCAHAVWAITAKDEEPADYLVHWYKKETYLKFYTDMLEVVSNFWPKISYDMLLTPPICKKLRARPKKKGLKQGWENSSNPTKITKQGLMHYSKCEKAGHKKVNVQKKSKIKIMYVLLNICIPLCDCIALFCIGKRV